MKKIDVIRAWKDEDYRSSLSAEELASLPANPAGEIELSRAELGKVSGGAGMVVCGETTLSCDKPSST